MFSSSCFIGPFLDALSGGALPGPSTDSVSDLDLEEDSEVPEVSEAGWNGES